MIFPFSSRSTRATVGLTAVGRAVVMLNADAVSLGEAFFSVPPVGAFRRDARPRRL